MDLEQKEITEQEPAQATQQPKSDVKLLVVDDREDNLFSIETILERDGYEIVKATSGRSALKILLKEQDFSLILMDVQMPDMNGIETASLIYQREKLREIPIIFITAHNQGEELLFKGYKMGGVDYIYKPINPDLLRFKVSVFVDLYRKNRQLLQQERTLKAINQSLEKEIEERRISESKIKLLNEQLLQNYQSLKATNEELDRFAYVASHDLQEPLRKIQLFSDKILRQGDAGMDGFVAENLEKITRASERMQQLINDLLKFSRHTQVQEDFVELDLNRTLQDALSDLEIEIEKKQLQVEVQQLPVVSAIPSQMQQLFQNLVSNSLKFCRADCQPSLRIYSEKLVVDVTEKGLPKVMHRIYFKDNGIGFDPKYADEIFVVFKRLHSYHDFAGSGIGLSICKKIVEKHNGNITATGKVNEGATFIITLPENQQP